jgi:hypothetical protein
MLSAKRFAPEMALGATTAKVKKAKETGAVQRRGLKRGQPSRDGPPVRRQWPKLSHERHPRLAAKFGIVQPSRQVNEISPGEGVSGEGASETVTRTDVEVRRDCGESKGQGTEVSNMFEVVVTPSPPPPHLPLRWTRFGHRSSRMVSLIWLPLPPSWKHGPGLLTRPSASSLPPGPRLLLWPPALRSLGLLPSALTRPCVLTFLLGRLGNRKLLIWRPGPRGLPLDVLSCIHVGTPSPVRARPRDLHL